jgi:sulfopyruvate decarboxylase subunit alpha
MTIVAKMQGLANVLCEEFVEKGFGPFLGTPCGILAPLYRALEERAGLVTVAREDNAVGIAAGAWLSGLYPVVLMQNSGLGQSVNAIASLVVPYRIAVLLVVGLRGVDKDRTQENQPMGGLTEPLLDNLGVPARRLDTAAPIDWAAEVVRGQSRPAALLVPPSLFGWRI